LSSAVFLEADCGEKFPYPCPDEAAIVFSLARAGTEGRARGEGAGAHAEAWTERWRNVAEEVAAAGAAAIGGDGSGDVGAEPVTAGFALWIDTLHRETGQVLHFFSLRGRKLRLIHCDGLAVATEKI
jgi:hypothetical protein